MFCEIEYYNDNIFFEYLKLINIKFDLFIKLENINLVALY